MIGFGSVKLGRDGKKVQGELLPSLVRGVYVPGYEASQPTKETIHCGDLLPRRKTCRFVREL